METTGQVLWNSIRQRVTENPDFELLCPWLDRLELLDSSQESLAFHLPDQALSPFLTRQHLHLLSKAASTEAEDSPSVILYDSNKNELLHYKAEIARTPVAPSMERAQDALSDLNRDYRFDTMVVGPANRLAHAAANAVAGSPGDAYNPLFMHGTVGMGKTHLLQATVNALRVNHPDKHVTYLAGESFLQQYASAYRDNTQMKLRAKLVNTDVLVFDNVHVLADDRAAQDEFFHIFNALYDSHKQIVLSSTHAPKAMSKIADSLLSRFKWGIIVELEPPTSDMRRIIVSRKAEQHNTVLPDDIISFLSDNISGSIRELEGAVMKLIGYASLLDRPFDLSIARQVLRDYLPVDGIRNITIKGIQAATCEAFNTSLTEMLSKKRSRSLVLPRHVAMHLARELTDTSLEEIGSHFGGRDHSTVKHGCEKIQRLLESDGNLLFTFNAIKRRLLASG